MLSDMEDEEAALVIDLSPETSSDVDDPGTPDHYEDTDGDCFRIHREYQNENSNFSQDCSTAVPSPSPSSPCMELLEDSQTSSTSSLGFVTINGKTILLWMIKIPCYPKIVLYKINCILFVIFEISFKIS